MECEIDTASIADPIRKGLRAAGVEVGIPAKVNRRNPAPHDRTKYKWRDLIERLSNKLEIWRRSQPATTNPRNLTSALSHSP